MTAVDLAALETGRADTGPIILKQVIAQDMDDLFGDLFGDFFGRKEGNAQKQGGSRKKGGRTFGGGFGHGFGSGASGGFHMGGFGQENGSRGADVEAEVSVSFDEAAFGCEKRIRLAGADGRAQSLQVRIPAGIDDGQSIRLQGKGQPGRGGAGSGDLFLKVKVGKKPGFERKGMDIYSTVQVPLLLRFWAERFWYRRLPEM